ncbi:MAG TPA: hypothetical protein VNJ08_13745 [Bacteriovoracaceae bacterium]|nr:hypothetical protein [Bacteriovoracaceae bacterium]
MSEGLLLKNIQYYGSYQLIYVITTVVLTSIGAFFHFLLDHEISIVEAWVHNNHWEILIVSKLLSLFLINRWFTMRLYQLKSIRELVKELVHWPDLKVIVISIFMVISYLSLAKITMSLHNVGYWYYHVASYVGLFLFFGIEFIVIAYLDDVLNEKVQPSRIWMAIFYTALFTAAYRFSIPDYYGLMPYVIFCFSSLIYLSGKSFRSWSNVLCFLFLFVAPMGSLCGLDPVWGEDFSPFHVEKKLNVALLAVVWVISFCYYKYRELFFNSARKLLR